MIKNQALVDRFLRYIAIDTQSTEQSETVPSTMKQHDLAKLLYEELKAFAIEDVYYDKDHCIVYANIPASEGMEYLPGIGFISHMDTSDAVTGANVKPRFIMNYDGNDKLLKAEHFKNLKDHIGDDLIATDGTTLLGGDNKSGIAEIMNLVEYYTLHPQKKHRAISIAFTPDEEIGHGVDYFDLNKFKAQESYTVDGGLFGTIQYETFNAAAAYIKINGVSVHPGTAKGVMKNASIIAMEFNAALPFDERPECTENREGFFMLMDMTGEVEKATLHYIIRDHNHDFFDKRKQTVREIAEALNTKYGDDTVVVAIKDQYYNMRDILKDHMELVNNAEEAIRSLGGEPVSNPIRGGTDGARLTFMGVPCPNLGTGTFNSHSRYEYVCIREMELCAETLIKLAGITK